MNTYRSKPYHFNIDVFRNKPKFSHLLLTALGAYTDAINDPDTIPNVESAWETYVRTKCAQAKKEALNIYDDLMSQLMAEHVPCEGDEILKKHQISQCKSMEVFVAETAEIISSFIENELRELRVSGF